MSYTLLPALIMHSKRDPFRPTSSPFVCDVVVGWDLHGLSRRNVFHRLMHQLRVKRIWKFRVQADLSTVTWIPYSRQLCSALVAGQLHWLPAKASISCNFTCHLDPFAPVLTPVSLKLSLYKCWTIGDHAFSNIGPSVWNSTPCISHLDKVPYLSQPLKGFILYICFSYLFKAWKRLISKIPQLFKTFKRLYELCEIQPSHVITVYSQGSFCTRPWHVCVHACVCVYVCVCVCVYFGLTDILMYCFCVWLF